MEVIISKDQDDVAKVAAALIGKLLRVKPNAVLGLATGATPVLLYQYLIEGYKKGEMDFSKVTTFNLDEYVGLKSDHPASYASFMQEKLFAHINVPKANVHIPDGSAKDIPQHCEAYEKAIQAAGGIDLQVLGIGLDGHIGFNEPTSSLSSRTRIKTLTQETREENRMHFPLGEEVPHHVLTMGIGTIMEARTCMLMACGKKKAKAVADAVEGPVTSMVPASVLQFHAHTKLLVDEGASMSLTRSEYYRYVYDNKPAWQKA